MSTKNTNTNTTQGRCGQSNQSCGREGCGRGGCDQGRKPSRSRGDKKPTSKFQLSGLVKEGALKGKVISILN
jgi:hypothetical protein|tara:strand:+ start:329 stop:544 length:216 start_codon:yes stop_codon:yes gene_type:complete